jgi:hypothetical protein
MDEMEVVIFTPLVKTLYDMIQLLYYRGVLMGVEKGEEADPEAQEGQEIKLFIKRLRIELCPKIIISIHLASNTTNSLIRLLPAIEDLALTPEPFNRTNVYLSGN